MQKTPFFSFWEHLLDSSDGSTQAAPREADSTGTCLDAPILNPALSLRITAIPKSQSRINPIFSGFVFRVKSCCPGFTAALKARESFRQAILTRRPPQNDESHIRSRFAFSAKKIIEKKIKKFCGELSAYFLCSDCSGVLHSWFWYLGTHQLWTQPDFLMTAKPHFSSRLPLSFSNMCHAPRAT